jgi:hypothetical protein
MAQNDRRTSVGNDMIFLNEPVIAALGSPVEFGDKQVALIKEALDKNPYVRWTLSGLQGVLERFSDYERRIKERA